jgi:hypothetical protein
VTDGLLQVGAKAENIVKDWIAFDDAKLEYLGLFDPYNFDVNGDDVVNIADVAKLVSIMTDTGNNSDRRKADVNADGVINIADLEALLNRILEKK